MRWVSRFARLVWRPVRPEFRDRHVPDWLRARIRVRMPEADTKSEVLGILKVYLVIMLLLLNVTLWTRSWGMLGIEGALIVCCWGSTIFLLLRPDMRQCVFQVVHRRALYASAKQTALDELTGHERLRYVDDVRKLRGTTSSGEDQAQF